MITNLWHLYDSSLETTWTFMLFFHLHECLMEETTDEMREETSVEMTEDTSEDSDQMKKEIIAIKDSDQTTEDIDDLFISNKCNAFHAHFILITRISFSIFKFSVSLRLAFAIVQHHYSISLCIGIIVRESRKIKIFSYLKHLQKAAYLTSFEYSVMNKYIEVGLNFFGTKIFCLHLS